MKAYVIQALTSLRGSCKDSKLRCCDKRPDMIKLKGKKIGILAHSSKVSAYGQIDLTCASWRKEGGKALGCLGSGPGRRRESCHTRGGMQEEETENHVKDPEEHSSEGRLTGSRAAKMEHII